MKRLNPFSGMQVSLFDLCFSSIETANSVTSRIGDLFNPGIINGLTVFSSGTFAGHAAVTPGIAYDLNGERLNVLTLQDRINYGGAPLNNAAASYDVILRYSADNDGTFGLDVDGTSQIRHFIDGYRVFALKTGVDPVQDSDIRLSRVTFTAPGSTFIIDSNFRDRMDLKITASGQDLSLADLSVAGTLAVGGAATFNDGLSTTSLYVNAGGLQSVGTACFFRTLLGVSNIQTQGEFESTTAGLGLIVQSPDGIKRARIGIDNDGFIAVEPLNYSF